MSFWEVFVIGIIALIVLGPERLPKAARTVGLWVGKAKQGFNSIKTEIDRELKVKEIQEQLKEQKENLENQIGTQSIKESLSETQQEIGQMASEIRHPLNQTIADDDQTSEQTKNKNDKPTTAD